MTLLLTNTETTTTPAGLAATTATTATTTTTTAPLAAVKGWHADPLGLHDLRYHDGRDWSGHVTHFGPVPCDGCRRHGS